MRVLVMAMLLLYMYMLMVPPPASGLQLQLTSSAPASWVVCPEAALLLASASPTSIEKKVSCMDILLPAIHMLMLRLPWSRAAATEDSQAHTSCRLAPAPGCEGAGVGEVAMLATRAALQLSRSRSCGV